MSNNYYFNADKIDNVRLLLEGIAQHKEELATVGLDDAYIQNLTQKKLAVELADAEQEKLKSTLKGATEKVKLEMKQLMKLYRKGRKLIKVVFPQTAWLEFGIAAKR